MNGAQVADIRRRLLAMARERKEQFGATLAWYVAGCFAQRLEQSDEREHLLLDGDLWLHAVVGGDPPFEWDAELTWLKPWKTGSIAKALRAVAAVDRDDGMTFGACKLSPRAICAGAAMGNVVQALVGASLGDANYALRLRVRTSDAEACQPTNLQLRPTLTGFPGSRPMGWAPAAYVADLVVLLTQAGIPHLRPKAYGDLYQLRRSGVVDADAVASALAAAFKRSGERIPVGVPTAFSAAAGDDEALTHMWLAYLARSRGHAIQLAAVVKSLRTWLAPALDRARALVAEA
jgi:hypothetical protein